LPAKACSCFRGDNYEAFNNSDAAFIGEFISRREANPPKPGEPVSSARPMIYTFRLQEEAKGEFGETVEVESAADGASCGLEVEPGESYGLLLYTSESGGWTSGLCSQMTPEDLREAARGLPAPDGEGPPKMLVGGSFGPATTISLDDQGRTLAYGYGEGDVIQLSVCPGSGRFAEVSAYYDRKPLLVIRDTKTMDVISQDELPLGNGYRGQQPQALLCRDSAGAGTIVVSHNYNTKRPKSFIWSVTGKAARKLDTGTASQVKVVGDLIYMREGAKGRTLSYFDPDTGERVRVASVPRAAGLGVSPDGNFVAGISGNSHSKITLADLSGKEPRIRKRTLGSYMSGDILWLDSTTLAMMPGGYDNSEIKVFDTRLNELKTVPGEWYTIESVLVGERAWGVGWGALYRAELTEGPAEMIRRLPTEVTYTLAPVP
jgi:hypothetical protein